jgi:hypothetical protein
MKKTGPPSAAATATAAAPSTAKRNGKNNGNSTPGNVAATRNASATAVAEPPPVDLSVILASLQTMREGDFSVRLPVSWTGLAGKVADTFNDIVAANQQMARELKRLGQAVGKEGKTRERTKFHESRGTLWSMIFSVRPPRSREPSLP